MAYKGVGRDKRYIETRVSSCDISVPDRNFYV